MNNRFPALSRIAAAAGGVVILACALSAPLAAQDRVALVIGNDVYPAEGNFPSLDNCARDAALIRTTLATLGFRVFHAENATRSEMDEVLLEFEKAIPKGGTAVLYFAGHGIEFNGKNYLMGSNARLEARSRLGEEAMDAETFASAMLVAGAKSSFLFLDCCREVPGDVEWLTRGTKKRGLAELNIDGDIIIAYAAKPGQAALDGLDGNSPYAKALAKWLPSGMKHNDLFDRVRLEVHQTTGGAQRTWESGSFLEPFFFKPGGAVDTAAEPPAPKPEASTWVSTPTPPAAMPTTEAGEVMRAFQERLIRILAAHPQARNSLVAVRDRMASFLEELEAVPTTGLPEDLGTAFLDYTRTIRQEYTILTKLSDDFPWGDSDGIQAWGARIAKSDPDLLAEVATVPQLEISIQQKGNLVDAIMAKYGIFIPNPQIAGTEAMRSEGPSKSGPKEAISRFRTQLNNAVKKNPAPQAGAANSEQIAHFQRFSADLLLVNTEGLPEDLNAAFEGFRKPILTIAQILAELPVDMAWDDPEAINRYAAELNASNPPLAQRLVSIGALAVEFQNAGVQADEVFGRYGIVID